MAECEWCGDETQPGDLTSKEIAGSFHFFCSEQHAHNYEEQGAGNAPRGLQEKTTTIVVTQEDPASAPKRRTRKPKAGPA